MNAYDASYCGHYARVPLAWNWPEHWPNFTPKEIACLHCGELLLDNSVRHALDCLQTLRNTWGKPIALTSAHRCAAHNRTVGGAAHSQHLRVAFDCICPAPAHSEFVRQARAAGFTGIGRYPDRGFVHIDCGPTREW